MDTVTPEERSRIMAKVKGSGNRSTERKMIRFFRESGVKGWRRNYKLPGKPDFVFPKARLALFVDGCFWHGCKEHCRIPATNREYWVSKINKNAKRDRLVTSQLEEKNWKVIRVWEHDLKKNRHLEKLEEIKNIVQS